MRASELIRGKIEDDGDRLVSELPICERADLAVALVAEGSPPSEAWLGWRLSSLADWADGNCDVLAGAARAAYEATDAADQLRVANGKRRERLLGEDDVLWAIAQAIRSRGINGRPVGFCHTAPPPVANAYRYRASRTVCRVWADPDGLVGVSVDQESANGNGRATDYTASLPEGCEAPWHGAYRI